MTDVTTTDVTTTDVGSLPPTRPVGPIVFDSILVVFTLVIVWQAVGLRGGAGNVPLVIGIPTLIGGLLILARDVRAAVTARTVAPDPQSLLAKVSMEDDAEFETPEARRRQALFALWVIAFVALATVSSFYVAVPVALLVLFVIVRVPPLAIVVTIGGVMLLLYLLFGLFLHIRL